MRNGMILIEKDEGDTTKYARVTDDDESVTRGRNPIGMLYKHVMPHVPSGSRPLKITEDSGSRQSLWDDTTG
jgi:hypothetical protein